MHSMDAHLAHKHLVHAQGEHADEVQSMHAALRLQQRQQRDHSARGGQRRVLELQGERQPVRRRLVARGGYRGPSVATGALCGAQGLHAGGVRVQGLSKQLQEELDGLQAQKSAHGWRSGSAPLDEPFQRP